MDPFPPGQEGAERVCRATLKPIAAPAVLPEVVEKGKVASLDSRVVPEWPQPPPLFGALAELDAMKRSWTWTIGRAMTEPVRVFRRLLLRLRAQGEHRGDTPLSFRPNPSMREVLAHVGDALAPPPFRAVEGHVLSACSLARERVVKLRPRSVTKHNR